MAKDNRFRSWSFIVYEDSAPSNWRDIIDERHIRWCCSPYHDRDFNADGTPKKPHYHIVLDFDGKKSFEQIKEISDSVNSPMPIHLDSVVGMVRYFTHMDNPEKAQYSASKIESYGGFDVWDTLKPTYSKKYHILAEMTAFIKEHNIKSFTVFSDYCRDFETDSWFPILVDCGSYYISQYIKANILDDR